MASEITASYIDHMGSDLSVVRAARVSFANDPEVGYDELNYCSMCATETGEKVAYTACKHEDLRGFFLSCEESLPVKDERLIAYLAKHDHWSPFAHTSITLRVSAPVPIRTQCFKHKQGFVENEESRRYIKSSPELYVPESFREAPPPGGVKQGSGVVHGRSVWWLIAYQKTCRDAINLYEGMVAANICPEQARFVLPQGCLVNWYWTGSLAAYARFYQQRTDPHAQKEIQDLAKVIGGIIEPLFPVAWKELTK